MSSLVPRRVASVSLYLLVLGIGVGLFLAIRSIGSNLVAQGAAAGATRFGTETGKQQVDVLLHVLIALIVIVAAARAVGRLGRLVGQPPVIGEIVAGLLLGPSFLGRIWPAAYAFVLPAQVAPLIAMMAQVGVVLFMFLVGVDLDLAQLREKGRASVAISHASIIVPFSLGSMLALVLYPRLATSDVPFTAFALFLGVSMSVTAFPVLARILRERELDRSPLGVLALACAAVDDVTAWCLLAFILGIVQSKIAGGAITLALSLVYLAAIVFAIRPLLAQVVRKVEEAGRLSQSALAATLVIALGSALATDAIGIHALFGAFAVGACIPPASLLARELRARIEDLVLVLFLPIFFAVTGMRTQLALLDGVGAWALCGLVIVVACVGKLGGGAVAAKLCGLSWRDSVAIGLLMNTRGLMELIVLNVGLELHILSPQLFAMLVLMAVVTTLMTSPLLGRWRGGLDAAPAQA